jgi:ABC-type iron transport system FetAB ATPase subunit
VVLRGATGSGKTLFLRTVADLDPADDGEVLLDGASRASVSAPRWRASVVYVHADPPRLRGTVSDNLARVAAIAGRPAEPPWSLPGDARAEDLSSGEAQLLALQRAISVRPRVILLDEGTRSLDPQTAREAEARVLEFVGDSNGVIWVSHEDSLAERVGARSEAFP